MMSPAEELRTGEIQDPEKVSDSCRENSVLVLSEEQAIATARSKPNDALPILIRYAVDDRDNPRNWPKWRKWYITCLVSMLNVFTCVSPSPCMVYYELNRDTGPGAREVSPPVRWGYRKNSESLPRSRRYVCLCTCWAMRLAPYSSLRSRSILGASRSTSCHGSACSSSSSQLLWLLTSAPFSRVGSSPAVPGAHL